MKGSQSLRGGQTSQRKENTAGRLSEEGNCTVKEGLKSSGEGGIYSDVMEGAFDAA